jgi:hypothetical protein
VTGVRAHGRVDRVPDAGPADHVCWVYDDAHALDAAAGRFLAGGLARGERLLVVGEGMVGTLDRETLPFGGTEALLATGALEILDLTGASDGAEEFTAEQQLAFYDEATRRARADGFTGLRVAAEGTALAADPATRPALVHWEHLADDFVARGSGFTALCAYRGDLCREALHEVASVHPVVHGPDGVPPFHVFRDENRVVLTGSVDTFSAGQLARVLSASPAARAGTVLDLGRLEFVDVAGCRVLAAWAGGLPFPVRVEGAAGIVRRMWSLLALDRMAPVTFLEPGS